ncbi:pyridoxal phosphate-dependent transferase [Parasitella parasitica]|nr:pyridoxal phosphate-dependent transferase [Parasitella parasitica]
MTIPKFGKSFRSEFSFQAGYTPLNHGSYGTYPNIIKPILRGYQDKAEEHPDRWNRFEQHPLLENNLKLIGQFINCDYTDLAFLPNASQGANNVLRSFPFKSGDKILYYQTGYINVNKTLEFLRDQYSVQLVKIDLNFPLEDAEIVELTKHVIEQEHSKPNEPEIVMAVIDALSSLPGVRLPFERLTKLVQKNNILALIDGAHAMGHIALDMEALDADFFFSNCHKWLYTPRGCSILYVPKRNQGYVHPTTITLNYEHHTKEHIPPTLDTSPYLCVEAALKYRESLGGEQAINDYCHGLAVKGGALVADILGTRVLENSTKTLTANMEKHFWL